MIVILVLLSIILNLFSILAIIILYKRMSIYQETVEELREEVDNSYIQLEKYMEAMDQENQAFYDKLINQFSQRELVANVSKGKEEPKKDIAVENQKLKREEQLKRVEELVKQGFHEEHIAKVLNTYKGEVQLMVNMIRKAEHYGADQSEMVKG